VVAFCAPPLQPTSAIANASSALSAHSANEPARPAFLLPLPISRFFAMFFAMFHPPVFVWFF